MTIGQDAEPEATTCSQDSFDASESPSGTAPTARRLVIVEQPGPWPKEALTTRALDPELRNELQDLNRSADTKVLLARHADRRRLDDERNVWVMTRSGSVVHAEHHVVSAAATSIRRLVDSGEARPQTVSGLQEVAAETSPGRKDPIRSTLFVCTNGARDACCAVKGRALLCELVAEFGRAPWEVSHIGGHRFAPTALRFPDGVALGRLDATAAEAAMSGRVLPAPFLRGRFGAAPTEQLSELAVSEQTGLSLTSLTPQIGSDPGQVTVTEASGRRWTVTLEVASDGDRLASCSKRPEAREHWVVTEVRASAD